MTRSGTYASVGRQYIPAIGLFVVTDLFVVGLVRALAPGLTGTPAILTEAVLVGTIAVTAIGAAIVRPYERRMNERGRRARIEEARFRAEVHRREFETRFTTALEMAASEDDALRVAERALAEVAPDSRAEVLLADNSHAHLDRVAISAPDDLPPECDVVSPNHCPAARRSQSQYFPDSEQIDACPHLRDRATGRCSALCVPVSVMGRTVGVVHVTDHRTHESSEPPPPATIADLEALAHHVGGRLGMLRAMAETQLQASTDGLTGLLNRRTLENKVRTLRAQGTRFVFALADLDHFKAVNDKHGHAAGDRALRLFATTLRSSLRDKDLVCRFGGEEFAVVVLQVDLDWAIEALDRVRSDLALAANQGGGPRFTASFGLGHSDDASNLGELVRQVDRALYQAKASGRDRIVTTRDLGNVPDEDQRVPQI